MKKLLALLAVLFTFAVQAEVYEPKPGTPERKAIMDAMRDPVSKHVGKTVQFSGSVKVSGNWATFNGDVEPKDGKPVKGDVAQDLDLDFFALLKKVDGEWKVLHWGFAGDIGVMEEAKKKYPKTPKELLPDFPK